MTSTSSVFSYGVSLSKKVNCNLKLSNLKTYDKPKIVGHLSLTNVSKCVISTGAEVMDGRDQLQNILNENFYTMLEFIEKVFWT